MGGVKWGDSQAMAENKDLWSLVICRVSGVRCLVISLRTME